MAPNPKGPQKPQEAPRAAISTTRLGGEQFAVLTPLSFLVGWQVGEQYNAAPEVVSAVSALVMAVGTTLLTVARNLFRATKLGKIALGAE